MKTQIAEEKTLQTQQEELSSNNEILNSDELETTPCNEKQIVLYDPTTTLIEEPQPDPEGSNPGPQRVLPSVGAYTVQCAMCYKWRLIPTKEKYEEIREHIMVQPFTCYLAKEWRPEVSCDIPGDVEQDNSMLWVIDKPSIPQTPTGWERELRIRDEGCYNFADVYYISPLGKRLRSIVEVEKYLIKYPEFIAQGLTLSQFSFKSPKPLQENYVRRRTLNVPGDPNLEMPTPFQTIEASPWPTAAETRTVRLSRTDNTSSPAKRRLSRQLSTHIRTAHCSKVHIISI